MNSILNTILTNNTDDIALENSTACLSYTELSHKINEFSKILDEYPCKTIGLYLGNNPLWIVISIAAHNTNKVVIPIPVFFSSLQIKHIINDSGLELIFSDQPLNDDTISGLSENKKHQYLDTEFYQYNVIHQSKETLSTDENIAIVTYTSGSTGTPKGVCLNESNLLNVAHSIETVLRPLALKRHL